MVGQPRPAEALSYTNFKYLLLFSICLYIFHKISGDTFFKKFVSFIWKVEKQRETQKKKGIFHLLVHCPNGHNSQSSTRLEPGATCVSTAMIQALHHLLLLLQALAEKWTKSGTNTPTGAHMECCHFRKSLNSNCLKSNLKAAFQTYRKLARILQKPRHTLYPDSLVTCILSLLPHP